MFTTPLRCFIQFRHFNGVVSLGNGNVGNAVTALGNGRNYSKDKGCCPDVPQKKGKKIEPWPKNDPPPPAWRCECPREPQPPNYDPYRIKVPDVVVPPLPAANAKWAGAVFTYDRHGRQDYGQEQGYQQPGPQQQSVDKPQTPETPGAEQGEEEQPKSGGGFFANLKRLFGFGKGKKEGEMSMIGKSEVPIEDGREPFKCPNIKFATQSQLQDLFHDSPIVHPDYWKDKPKKGIPAAVDGGILPRLGYHGKTKYKFAFHEPWKPLDRVTLMAQAEKEELEMSGVIEAAVARVNRAT